MFQLIKTEGSARRGEFVTPHGTVQTPAFMNVATCGAIKGAVSALDLKNIKCQVQLCNTYHLHLRPGDDKVRQLGGLHRFTRWDGPILTDSGGFQVFSLAKLRNIKEEGVYFNSHIDGRKIFMGPEESMNIQSSASRTPLPMNTHATALRARRAGSSAVSREWHTSTVWRKRSTASKCSLASTRAAPTAISVSTI